MKAILTKTQFGFIPSDERTKDWFNNMKLGQVVRGEFRKMRNYGFHKKLFALLNLAYEYWTPEPIDTKWGTPEKNFDVFRKNVTILAGYGEPVFNIDGTFKMQAKSISFAKMDQETFEDLYNRVLDVLVRRIPVMSNIGKDEINKIVNQILEFA